jgi:hypothetical protein
MIRGLPDIVEATDVRLVGFGVYARDDGTNEIGRKSELVVFRRKDRRWQSTSFRRESRKRGERVF